MTKHNTSVTELIYFWTMSDYRSKGFDQKLKIGFQTFALRARNYKLSIQNIINTFLDYDQNEKLSKFKIIWDKGTFMV